MLITVPLLCADVALNSSSWTRKILDVSGFVTKIYPAIAMVLFFILAQTVTLHLRSIRFRIRHQLNQLPKIVDFIQFQCSLLKVLRKQHRLACYSVRKLNRYFGIFFSLEVVFIFVGVTNCFMFVLMSVLSGDKLMGTLNSAICLDLTVHLFFLTSYSDNITKEVITNYSIRLYVWISAKILFSIRELTLTDW